MVSKAHDQERFIRKLLPQVLLQAPVLICAYPLAAQELVDVEPIFCTYPIGVEILPESEVPRSVIGGRIDEEKYWAAVEMQPQLAERKLVVVGVRLTEGKDAALLHTEIDGIEKVIEAGGRMIPADTEKIAVGRIDAECPVTASAQCQRQAALDTSVGNPGHDLCKSAVRADR